MAVNKTFAGTTYSIPQNKDPKSTNWGTQVSNFLQALADYALPRTGGDNQLTAEMNFSGASFAGSYGVKLPYLKAAVADASLPAAGFLRLANSSTIQWKGSSTDLSLSVSGSDRLQFAGTNLYQPADADSANTASKLVLRDASGNFAAGTITASSFVGPITGNADTATKWQTARTITLGTDLTGSVSIDGSADVTLNATIAANSVALGTDTTGDYVQSLSGTANQVTVTGGTGESSTPVLSLPQDIATTSSPTFANVSITNSPTLSNHAANKSYVDTVAQGLDVKQSVKAATTANITLSGTQTIDGVALSVDERVLVKNQSTQADNGLYLVKSSSWVRTDDASTWDELVGAFCFVEQGSTLADTGWVCTVNSGGSLGVTAVTFSQFSGVGSYQPLDTTLTNIAALTTTNGLIAWKNDETVYQRTLTGTANKIVITDGDGALGNPTFNIGTDVVTLTDSQNLTNKLISSTAALTGALKVPAGTTAERPTAVEGYVRYNSDTSAFEGYASGAWSSLGGGGTVDRVTQASHGFSVGNILYLSGTTYTKAIATAANTAEVVGMVSRVVDTNTFEITLSGEVTGLTSLTAGEVYFLSTSSAGAMTVTEPTTIGYVSVPLGVASSTTTFYVAPKRGNVIGGTNARTQISLANNTTANIQDVSAYDAGELSGWISITATTPLKFYVSAPFAKNGAGSNYNISPSYVGDTPPSGFSLSITSAGIIQYTMPNVTGFSAANINYGLDVAAVGATFPLSISGTNVVNGTPTLDTINEYTSTNGVQIKGRTSGSAIAAGYIGERLSASPGSAVSIAGSGNGTNVTSISLSAGIWLVSGVLHYSVSAITGGVWSQCGVSLNSDGTFDNLQSYTQVTITPNTSSNLVLHSPMRLVNVSTSTTIRLVGALAYSTLTGTYTTNSQIQAIRIA
jgi:hypothetical protein